MAKVIIIGGGAAGMIAAYSAALTSKQVILLEKNEKLGKKIFITGKGRCNLTNASDMNTVMENVVSNKRFLFSAFKKFTNEDIMRLVEENGTKLKIERGNRVFPVSDHSSDIIKSLENALRALNVDIRLNTKVDSLLIENDICKGVLIGKSKIMADDVIVATGGMSYQATGSDGDGYRFAKEAGLSVSKLYPSLVPFNIEGERIKALQGLSLKNVHVYIYNEKNLVYDEFGEMLFTHFGVSGPVIISASAIIGNKNIKGYRLCIDLKPALDEEKLDERILRDFTEQKNKSLKNSLNKLFPAKLIDEVIYQSKIDPEKKVNLLTKEERQRLVHATKNLEYVISSTRGFNEAIITKGGVEVSQINPKTMESKKIKGLFFAGEVLDLDAFTGGYNLQIAWSTGYAAGEGAGE
ncbi:NAD(P)/FAD-dependent oxidoreductase [Lachnoanaerobaculum sp. Marseille-Q4761]|uniref:NAD(P)/FAD-dependent oxidoreductase n=1 Tax=Lachnoanaerobaculum sp. Marseille-Q4761 TaxID=2819511 RepID=UPI001AA10F0C|nr:NAD(P)/FAD-dependent oxidoreductase [Lachnoanaerobaculum sp. Marseille-Q4761]MBO1871860.1 NAD(P)/FAD-dependent oxidoreductase [Lachnoanaerobaculum sp. Marseille-Q4761]